MNFRVLHAFRGRPDGAVPAAGVIRDAAGNLYGTTFSGGSGPNVGVVFKIDPGGNETILHNFNDADGAGPEAPLIEDSAGNFYGSTIAGGTGCCGMMYKLDQTGNLTILHSFNYSDGSLPHGLFQDSGGTMYGATREGGKPVCRLGCGVVFRLLTSGSEKVVHIFSGLNGTGRNPLGTLVEDSAGNLYGTTFHGGGIRNDGSIFKLGSGRHETVLHRFNGADGAHPLAGVVLDSAGDLFGTTSRGGSSGRGVVFELNASGKYIVLHNFNGADGSIPDGELIHDDAGNLYGTTLEGGNNGCNKGCGVVFELSP